MTVTSSKSGTVPLASTTRPIVLVSVSPQSATPSPNRGKVVFITGCTRGLGKALIESFCRDDSVRMIIGVSKEQDAIDELKKSVLYELAGHKLNLFVVDVTDADAVEQLVTELKQQDVVPDLLINNAGIFGPPSPMLKQESITEQRPTIQTNVVGAYNFIRCFLPLMINNSDAACPGVIVNISGEVGRSAFHRSAPSSVAQFALEGLTVCVAHDIFASQNVSIVSVYPGMIITDMLIESKGEEEAFKMGTPLEDWQRSFPKFILGLGKSHSGRHLSWPEDVELISGKGLAPESVKPLRVPEPLFGQQVSGEKVLGQPIRATTQNSPPLVGGH